eukprot:2182704-Prymnesium_polylepis.1
MYGDGYLAGGTLQNRWPPPRGDLGFWGTVGDMRKGRPILGSRPLRRLSDDSRPLVGAVAPGIHLEGWLPMQLPMPIRSRAHGGFLPT